ncbi:MAG: hypothetical protein Tsb009_19640 [Planctomycetaceae bacterium]
MSHLGRATIVMKMILVGTWLTCISQTSVLAQQMQPRQSNDVYHLVENRYAANRYATNSHRFAEHVSDRNRDEFPSVIGTSFDSRATEFHDSSVHSRCCLPSWKTAGTLFRWSFSDETGGPDLNEPLVTDRPDFTEASSTVGRGVAQVEFGYTYSYDSQDGTTIRDQSWGEPLLRYGILANWLELRLGLFPVEQRLTTSGRANSTAGTEDLYLGLKIGLTPQAGYLPEMALIPQMTVPTGSPAFTNDRVLPGANLIYGWEINEWLSTAGSTQINRAVDEGSGRTYSEIAQSWTISTCLTEEFGLYTEWFAFFPHSADTAQVEHFFNFGLTWLINNDVQWDVRYGRGLNRAATDYFVGTGLSIRFR